MSRKDELVWLLQLYERLYFDINGPFYKDEIVEKLIRKTLADLNKEIV